MYTFPQSFTPALRGHLSAQLSFADDLSRTMLLSFEKLCGLNMRALRALIDTAVTPRPQRGSEMHANIAGVAVAATQPAIEKIRSYQQDVSRLAVEAQAEMAHVMQEHSAITSRAARTLSDEVVRTASEEMERGARSQQETFSSFAEPFQVVRNASEETGRGVTSQQEALDGVAEPLIDATDGVDEETDDGADVPTGGGHDDTV